MRSWAGIPWECFCPIIASEMLSLNLNEFRVFNCEYYNQIQKIKNKCILTPKGKMQLNDDGDDLARRKRYSPGIP
jgi:hypothetical protein